MARHHKNEGDRLADLALLPLDRGDDFRLRMSKAMVQTCMSYIDTLISMASLKKKDIEDVKQRMKVLDLPEEDHSLPLFGNDQAPTLPSMEDLLSTTVIAPSDTQPRSIIPTPEHKAEEIQPMEIDNVTPTTSTRIRTRSEVRAAQKQPKGTTHKQL